MAKRWTLAAALLISTLAYGPRLQAAVMGGPKVVPYDQALATTVDAAEAVLERRGAESCLRGKLTNAVLGLSASCGAIGQRSALCQLADQAAVVTGGWSLGAMDVTARELLKLAQPAASVPATTP